MASRASGIFHDLFAPVPEALPNPKKDLFGRIADYVESATGAWDLFAIVDRALSNLKILLALPQKTATFCDRASHAISTIGVGLSLPALVSDANCLRLSIKQWQAARRLSPQDPLKVKKIIQATKKSFLSLVGFVNTVSQAAWFIDSIKLCTFTIVHLRILDGIYYITSAISDGVELGEVGLKLYKSEWIGQKKYLAWMKVAKDVTSVTISLIAIVGICLSSAAQIFALTALLLNTFWLAMKISCYFYEQSQIEYSRLKDLN